MANETRQDVVEAKIAAAKEKYGPDARDRINAVCIEEIAISVAMLVDAGGES